MRWTIDPSHTTVEFGVRHMGLATVRGRFKKVIGSLSTSDGGQLQTIEATIEAASIDTGEPQRDAHLRSADFLNAEQHPHITFKSTGVEPGGPNRYRVTGELAMRGIVHQVTLEVEVTAPITDPHGHTRAAASGTGRLNRKNWGLTWNQALEFGALLVGEEVRFSLEVEAVQAAEATA